MTARNSTDASPNHDLYYFRIAYGGTPSPGLEFAKVVNGTITLIDTVRSITVTLPDTLEIQCNDSAMVSRLNGATEHNFTDTAITGNLRCGMTLRRTTDAVDDFSAEDLVLATRVPPQIQMQPILAQ